jgi:2,3-dihydroxyphenylpropionate 1,2-dioxygenase
MPMNTRLICASHSPLMYCYKKKPEHWDDLQASFCEQKQAIEAFDPELVIAFGSDHFNGFFLRLMPPFCIGFKAEAVGDIGGFPGKLDVPGDLAAVLAGHLRGCGVDPAVSYDMTVDHAFSQSIHLMLGELDARPVIPIFINCINRPFVPFKRSRLLGTAVGRWVRDLSKRVLLLASGGLSHHPTRYYPAWGEGEKAVAAWQLSGGSHPDSLTKEQWLKRLDVMHHEGAEMIAGGTRTAKDMFLNAEADRQFLDVLVSGELEEFDAWNQEDMVDRAGIGSMEQHTWIAASAAHLACGGDRPRVRHYSVALEIGIAAGVAFAE